MHAAGTYARTPALLNEILQVANSASSTHTTVAGPRRHYKLTQVLQFQPFCCHSVFAVLLFCALRLTGRGAVQ